MTYHVYLSLGSNLGDREENLTNAIDEIADLGALKAISSLYEAEPWGLTEQDYFYNIVLLLETSLEPDALLTKLQEIENLLGRKREIKWGPRTIDIDIISIDSYILDNEQLKVPHPFIQDRKFVLIPLKEIAPDYIHPSLHLSVNDLLKSCTDTLKINKL